MTRILTRLLGRLPIGWLQLQHNKTRLIAAIGGVAFANILILMQLGFMGALFETSVLTHRSWDADLVIAPSDFQTLRLAGEVPRSRMFQALATEGIESALPIYVGSRSWTDPVTDQNINFRVTGIPLDQDVFLNREIDEKKEVLREPSTGLIDSLTRQIRPEMIQAIQESGRLSIELASQTISLVGTFPEGASFDVDGSFIVSDQTFFSLFPNREAGAPTLIFLRAEPGGDLNHIAQRLNHAFPETDAIAYTKEQMVAAEQSFQATITPIGFVFSFGVVMGVVVGLIIVYQVLTTDVQDHLAEYATLKAIGYDRGFFRGIIFEEAVALATLGFIPGLLVSLGLYKIASEATALPIEMPWLRPVAIYVLTVLMCLGSGLIAARKLNAAQPAELF